MIWLTRPPTSGRNITPWFERKLPTDCVSSTNLAASTLATSTEMGLWGPPGPEGDGAEAPDAPAGGAKVGLFWNHQAAEDAATTPTKAIAR